MIRIGKQLGRYFTLVSISSVLLITILTNIGMNVFFSVYLRESQETKDQTITGYTEELLEEDGFLSNEDLMSIEHYAFTMKAEVILENSQNQVLMSTREPINETRENLDRTAYMDRERFSYREYEYGLDGENHGTIVIGRTRSIFSAPTDRRFLITINIIYFLAAAVSIIFGLALRDKVTRKFLRPIYAIQDNAKYIEKGNFSRVRSIESDTIELGELADSIAKMSLRLEGQDRLRKRLTADIAHELRTPLATVNSHLEAFVDGVWEPTEQRLILLQEEIRRLSNLIKDLGDLSYMESGQVKLSLKEISLSELLLSLVENFKPLFAADKKIFATDIQEDVLIFGDKDRLNQVFINVVSNALKYTAQGSRVKIKLVKTDNLAEVIVKDNGIGISKEDIPFIFDRLYRGDVSRSREKGGKGIGLTIAKALIEAHQGSINVESEVGQGTAVRIRLPLIQKLE